MQLFTKRTFPEFPPAPETPAPTQRSMHARHFADNEWGQLREALVGRAEHSCFPNEDMSVISNICPRYYLDEFAKPHNPFPVDVVNNAQKELDGLAAALKQHGVIVHRPAEVDWVSRGGYTGAMPRDGLMVVGNTIFESHFSWRTRKNEIELMWGDELRQLESDEKYRVIRAPAPPTPDRIHEVPIGAKWAINNSRVAFDTADFVRIGTHIVGVHSNTTNQKGMDFLRAHLPEGYGLIELEPLTGTEMHIDTTFLPIMPGTALYNPNNVSEAEIRSHKPLNMWRLLPLPYQPSWWSYPPPFTCHPTIVMNVLCLNERTVFVEAEDARLQTFFKELGMDVIALPFKNVMSLGGSFHCATVDLWRDAEPSDKDSWDIVCN